MVDTKGCDFATPKPLSTDLLAVRSGSCSYCETMYKNLQYLESYLRSNTAKNSCNSCATCLSFLLYMKQQSVTHPRLEQYTTGEYGLPQATNLPPGVTTDCYAIQQTVTYKPGKSPVLGEAASLAKQLRLKSNSSVSKTKSLLKPKLSKMAPSRLTKSQPGVAAKKRTIVVAKRTKKLIGIDKKSSFKATTGLSAEATTKPISKISKFPTGNKRKRATVPSTKSSLSKDSTVKKSKQKKISRAPRKKVKISKV